MQGMCVITCIIWSICDIHMIWIFEYFKSNNNAMQVMWGGFELSISAMRVMQVFEFRWGSSQFARPRDASICNYSNISNSVLIFDYA